MADDIGTLSLKMTTDATPAVNGLKQFEDKATESAGRLKNAFTSLAPAAQTAGRTIGDALKGDPFAVAQQGAQGLVASITSIAGPAGIAAAAIIGIGAAMRSASKELYELSLLSKRLGETTDNTQVLLAGFRRGGLDRDSASTVLARFARVRGDAALDVRGASATTFRELNLDPSQLGRAGGLEAIEQVIGALSQLTNTAERAAYAENIFGRNYDDLSRAIANPAIFREADARLRGSGTLISGADVATAERAERTWREVSNTFEDVFQGFKNDVLGPLAQASAQVATGLVSGFSAVQHDFVDSMASLGTRISNFFSASSPDVAAANTAQTQGDSFAAREARRQAELARLAARTPQQVARDNQAAADEETRRRQAASAASAGLPQNLRQAESVRERLRLMQQETQLGASLRSDAERYGYIGADATTAEVEAVRALVTERAKLASDQKATAAQLAAFDDRARQSIQQRLDREQQAKNDAVTEAAKTAERENRIQRIVQAEGASLASARERVSVEEGINGAQARRLRLAEEEAAFRTRGTSVQEANLTPLERFRFQAAQLREDVARGLNPELAGRDIVRQFQTLRQSLGNGPSSFAIIGLTRGSLDEAKFLDDLTVRQRNGQNGSQEVADILRASLEIEQEARRQRDQIIAALDRQGVPLLAAPN